MAVIAAIVGRILGLVSQILGITEQILGIVQKNATETQPLAIQTIAANGTNEILNPFHGVAAVKTDLDAVRTSGNLTLQSVIDAMPGTGEVVLPPTPPEGYGGMSVETLLNTQVTMFDWYSGETSYYLVGAWTHSADAANIRAMGDGYRHPNNLDFVYCGFNAQEAATELWNTPPGDYVTPPPPVDWADWNGTDGLVTFLASQMPTWTWTETGPLGSATPGYAWSPPNSPYNGWWRCIVHESELPARSGIARIAPKKAEENAALSMAVGLASMFAIGALDIPSLVAQITTLLASSGDIEAALTSLMNWLSGRSQSTNQAQSTQLTVVEGYTDDVEGAIAQAVIDLAADVLAVRGTDDPTIADVRSDLSTIRGDTSTTLKSLKDQIDALSSQLDTMAAGAPIWPGLSGVTLGTPVALDAGTIVDGPMDGVLLNITAMERLIPYMSMDTFHTYRNLGRFAFSTDNGYLEDWRGIPNQHALLTPLRMRQADKLYISCYTGVTGTATPYLVDA